MPQGDKIYFLADMHLKPLDALTEPARAAAVADNQRLARFLETVDGRARAIVLLGDTFNFWFERGGVVTGDYTVALSLFKAAADNGIEIHHVSGNRDFIIPGFFPTSKSASRLTDYGIQTHGPRWMLHHQGKTILCIHGDALCLADKPFMLLRGLLQGPVGRAFWRWAPRTLIDAIVERQQARMPLLRSTPRTGDLFDHESVCREVVHGADRIVCGHIHRQYERRIDLPGGFMGRLVSLPPWLDGWYGYLEGGDIHIRSAPAAGDTA